MVRCHMLYSKSRTKDKLTMDVLMLAGLGQRQRKQAWAFIRWERKSIQPAAATSTSCTVKRHIQTATSPTTTVIILLIIIIHPFGQCRHMSEWIKGWIWGLLFPNVACWKCPVFLCMDLGTLTCMSVVCRSSVLVAESFFFLLFGFGVWRTGLSFLIARW